MRIVTLSISFACIACKREPSEPPTPVERPAPQASTPDRTVEPMKDVSQLVEHLRYEAAHRPASPVSADVVLDALDHTGVKLDGRHQYAGFTMNAKYCAGGRTAAGIAVAVCEYATPDAAVAGKAFMDQRFAAMAPDAKREAHGGAVLTIAGAHDDALVANAFHTFTQL